MEDQNRREIKAKIESPADDKDVGELVGVVEKKRRGRTLTNRLGRPSSSADSEVSSNRSLGRPPPPRLGHWKSTSQKLTPHVLLIAAGEDIAKKLSEFSCKASQNTCILSVFGSVSAVDLFQQRSGGITKFKGTLELLYLSIGFRVDKLGQICNTLPNPEDEGKILIKFAAPTGQVFGGTVAGLLTAATPIQIIMASYGDKRLPNAHTRQCY